MAIQPAPQLGSTLFSFGNPFLDLKLDFAGLVREVARRNLGPCLEFVGYQSIRGFPEVTDAFAESFKALIAETGLLPSCLGINSDTCPRPGEFITADESLRQHERQVTAAGKLGMPVVRYQAGAGTATVERLLPLAEKLGIKLGLEIHAPERVDSPKIIEYRELYLRLNSPLLGFIPDFGASGCAVPKSFISHFRSHGIPEDLLDLIQVYASDPREIGERRQLFLRDAKALGADMEQVAELMIVFPLAGRMKPEAWLEIMPQVVHVHGKFYDIDEDGRDTGVDQEEVFGVFIRGGYTGTVSSEWEGQIFSDADGFDEVAAHQRLLRSVIERTA